MGLFEKKVNVFQKKDREGWQKAKEALKAAGVRGIAARHYEVEPPVGGCGSKLDVRNFGPNGRIDREMYSIDVPEDQAEKARELLKAL